MSRGILKSSRFSPGNLDDDSLEALFVGRDKDLQFVHDRLKASALGRQKHYILLVGPRGSGKTHFLALVNSRITRSPDWSDARDHLRVAYLNEEEWGVASYLDLLLRIIQSTRSTEAAAPLEERISVIEKTYLSAPTRAIDLAESLLAELVGKKALLLICENLGD